MLDYTKLILRKVSFSRELFGKELRKSIKWLKKDEILLLQTWCVITFGDIYGDVIQETFKQLL
jgi:3-phosphoglycerate kinase